MGVELKCKAHWGALVKRWIYAVGLLGLAVGLSFLTQYLWQIVWYHLYIPVAAVIVLGMLYNTVNTLRTRVYTDPSGEAVVIEEGVLGRRVHRFAYARITEYHTKPSPIDDKLGCVSLTLTAMVGAQDKEECTVCLSTQNANILLDILSAKLAG